MKRTSRAWQEAVIDSLRPCQKLPDLTARDPDFIHPIVLIQVEEKGQEGTYWR